MLTATVSELRGESPGRTATLSVLSAAPGVDPLQTRTVLDSLRNSFGTDTTVLVVGS